MTNRLMIVMPLLLLAACATTDRKPIIDTRGVDPAAYRVDLEECRSMTDQVDVGQQLFKEVILGAVIGGAFGFLTGSGDFTVRAAETGAIVGAGSGVATSIEERNAVLHNCLYNRGYIVLN